MWNNRTISYAVASNRPIGEQSPNPRNDRMIHLVVANKHYPENQWHSRLANLRQSFREIHHLEVDQIEAIIVVVDGDNSAQANTTGVRNLRLSSE